MYTSKDTEKFINELIDLVVRQEKEIERLEKTIARVNKYIEVYEDYIKGE